MSAAGWHGGSQERPDRLESSGRRAGTGGSGRGRKKEVVDLGNLRRGAKGLSTVGEDGSEFISASRHVWDEEREEEGGEDILEKLEAKAAKFAQQARHLKRQAAGGNKANLAKFGGAKAQLSGGGADVDYDGVGSLEQLELKFVRDMEDGIETFVEPDGDDDHGDGDAAGFPPPSLTTNNVWDDLQYQERKEEVVSSLVEIGHKVKAAAQEIPRVRVDNDRLEIEKASLQFDMDELEAEEKRLFKKYPELGKKFEGEKVGKEGVMNQGRRMSQDDKFAEKMKERERKKEREMRRRRQIDKGVEELEDLEDDGDQKLMITTLTLLRSFKEQVAAAEILWLEIMLRIDPFTKSVEYIRLVRPLAMPYFQAARWQGMQNMVMVLPIIPVAILWASGWPSVGDTIITPTTGFLLMMMPYKALYIDIPFLYIGLFVAMYASLFYGCTSRIFTDLEAMSRGNLRKEKEQYKYSRVVLNSWNSNVHSSAEGRQMGNAVISQFNLFKDQEEMSYPSTEEEWGAEEDMFKLRLIRGTECFVNLLMVVLTWTLLEVFLPDDIKSYPQGIERLIAPLVAATINVWLIPIGTRELVKIGQYPPRLASTIEYTRAFAGRWANIVIMLRRQYLTMQDSSRVFRGAGSLTDACYCEDEVGVTLFWYWLVDWAMIQIKCAFGPVVFVSLRNAGLLQFHGSKPEFIAATWLVDAACNQLLLLLSMPLYPVTGILAQGTSILAFYIQRACIVNFWGNPKTVHVDVKVARRAFSLVSFSCLLVATIYFFYIWSYVSTKSLDAPICRIPVLYENATQGLACNYDPTTGLNTTVDCAPYLETACKGRPSHGGGDSRPLFYDASPSAVVSSTMTEVVQVVGVPLLAWAVAVIIFLRYMVQRNYRRLFEQYVDEKRYRLLIEQTNLERSLKKLDRMLDIQRNN